MPQEPHQNHLFIIEDEKGRREYTLDAPVYSIGRDPKCDIRLVSQFVSRRHATLVQLPNEDGSYYYRIVDGNLKGKGSANGLLINGRKFHTAYFALPRGQFGYAVMVFLDPYCCFSKALR